MNIMRIKDMFGNETKNTFEVKYQGPSFKDEFYDIDLLSKQLKSLDELIKQSLRENKLSGVEVKRKVKIKKGSLIETILLITKNPTFAASVGPMIGGTISALLVYYLTNKNKTNKKLGDHENMISLIRNRGDSLTINIQGNDNNFYLAYDQKVQYLINLQPKETTNIENEKFVGRFRKIDLNKRDDHRLGLDIEGVEKKNIPTKFSDSEYDIRQIPLDVDFEILGKMEYKNGEVKSVVIDSIKSVNSSLFEEENI